MLEMLDRSGISAHVEHVREALWLAMQGVRIDLTDFSPAPEAPLPLPGPASSGGKPGAPPGVPPPPDLPAEETNPFAGTPPAPAETAAPGQTGAAKLYAMGEAQAGE